MAHFAKLNDKNEVIDVQVVHNNVITDADGVEQEQKGIDFLNGLFGDANWKQVSYNTIHGKHEAGGVPLRKNYCGPGWIYHPPPIDGFSPPRPGRPGEPFESWTLDEKICDWIPPEPFPTDGRFYEWMPESGEHGRWEHNPEMDYKQPLG